MRTTMLQSNETRTLTPNKVPKNNTKAQTSPRHWNVAPLLTAVEVLPGAAMSTAVEVEAGALAGAGPRAMAGIVVVVVGSARRLLGAGMAVGTRATATTATTNQALAREGASG
jgi:hypothetical protein